MAAPRTSFEAVAKRLRRQVEAMGPQARLKPERTLAALLGCSRDTLRRALQALENDGLIWRHVGQGTFTGPRPAAEPIRPSVLFELATPTDLMNARLVIEPAMAAEAAERATTSDIATLRSLATETRDARDWRTYEAADNAFHRAIAAATSNHLLMAILGMLSMVRDRAPWQRQHGRAFGHGPQWEYSLRQGDLHLSLVDAVAAGDPARARAVMHQHLSEIAGLMADRPA
ncbi:MAG: FCD domain-containing protein [Phenylobacterium sp.]|uniref:FadR/GntR family transcriptional regulator n=1 Tax=Phenylobacterium sp. TaxID=1871053 RepID=UPI0027222881|nr:FCD domain-containing protein [Phenylobacterium sp.]MDO9430388.1 FCD domain-containing protein [Phenylobacterium sp.]